MGSGFTDLSDGPLPGLGICAGSDTEALTISSLDRRAAGRLCLAARNACGDAAGDSIEVRVCPVDVDCDGAIGPVDLVMFVHAFEAGDSLADFNDDGFMDFFDSSDLVAAFELGC